MLDGTRIASFDALELEPSKRTSNYRTAGHRTQTCLTRSFAVRRSIRESSAGRSAIQSTSAIHAAPIKVPLCTPFRLAAHELDVFVDDVRQLAEAGKFRGGV